MTADHSEWLAHVSTKLRELARRWLSFGAELHVPSDPPALLDKLTDELLVVSVDAVSTEVGLHRRLETVSGKAQTRLLAWVVADARGAQTPLEKALADTIGRRLERQAERVRDATSVAAATAKQARARAQLAAAADPSLAATLPAALADIDAAERLELAKPRSEVYVGFHELAALLPRPAEPPAAAAESAAAAEPAAESAAASVLAAALQAVEPEPEPEIPAIPPDLARALGRDGVQALWRFHHRDDHGEHLSLAESVDWHKYLPGLVVHTLIDNIWSYEQGKADGVSEVSEAIGEDEDRDVRIDVQQVQLIALLKARISDLERQLRRQARGEKVESSASIAPPAPRAGDKRARS